MTQGSQREPVSLGMERMFQEQRANAARRLRVDAPEAWTSKHPQDYEFNRACSNVVMKKSELTISETNIDGNILPPVGI
tara:strand:- start:52 stop:288 length:237 start_codon:yes stop_codon:yes gene_type:complete